MITRINQLFLLETSEITYCFQVLASGHLEHLYFGKKITVDESYDVLTEKVEYIGGNMISYSEEFSKLGLEDRCLEFSTLGKGDIREAFVGITKMDGSTTCDFLFQSARIEHEKEMLTTLPCSYFSKEEETNQENKQCLIVTLKDKNYGITMELIYTVFEDCHCITRSVRIQNESEEEIEIDRIMSMQLDFPESDYKIRSFHGAWAREMEWEDRSASHGIFIIDSKTGTSSNRNNPFFMVSKEDATEDAGECYGFNLIYSGNHYAACEVNAMDKLHVISGIQPAGFGYTLKKGEMFESPEAVMTCSNSGYGGMSQQMHLFVKEHIVRGEWKEKKRPVLMNSWEANYFKFNEHKLIKQAEVGAAHGIELFVLDDGWFGKREDDTSSLGDWQENTKKLKGGLSYLAEKINALGMQFGIWVEPEMINEDSECFRNHPDWIVKSPKGEQSLGRNQLILDLTKPEVRDYIITEMSRVFSSANISYVKWDMNRIFSDTYSTTLAPKEQKEFLHRYIMGLYEVLDKLTTAFPHILFESCASGGNRFDLGMLCYMPQIWASDNTDAISRAKIQTGYSFGYPISLIGAHVSGCPNHQTLRNTSIDTRFEVAAFGLLGYECNIGDLTEEESKAVKNQIAFYKNYRETCQFGNFYRIKTGENGIYQWMVVSKDQKEAIGLFLQEKGKANQSFGKFKAKGLMMDKKYHFSNRAKVFNIKEFGDLINMISPIHIKKDSLAHNVIAKYKKMNSETENGIAYGDVFCNAGVKLKQAFSGTGYNDEMRLFGDYASRMYLWEEIE